MEAIYSHIQSWYDDRMKTPEGREILKQEVANLQGIPVESVKLKDEL